MKFIAIIFLLIGYGAAAQTHTIAGWSQGCTVLEDTVYCTADNNPPGYNWVIKFNIHTFDTIGHISFDNTYDTSPLIVTQSTGKKIIIAHEKDSARTKAFYLNNTVAWEGLKNQPGNGQFGYTWFKHGGITYVYYAENGLHCINTEDGTEVWSKYSFYQVQPAIDTTNGVLYWQYQNTGGAQGMIAKIDALTGTVIDSLLVGGSTAGVWSTLYVNDNYCSDCIITQWYSAAVGNCSVKVFGSDLTLKSSITGLTVAYKHQPIYYDGKIITGFGNGFVYPAGIPAPSNTWRKVRAWNISDGSLSWNCDVSADSTSNCICMVHYDNCVWAVCESGVYNFLFYQINDRTGNIIKTWRYNYMSSACAPAIITHGKLISGNRLDNKIYIYTLDNYNRHDKWDGAYQEQNCYMNQSGRVGTIKKPIK